MARRSPRRTSAMEKTVVRGVLADDEVLAPIVRPKIVHMMDYYAGWQRFPECVFRDDNMRETVFPIYPHLFIAFVGNGPATTPCRII